MVASGEIREWAFLAVQYSATVAVFVKFALQWMEWRFLRLLGGFRRSPPVEIPRFLNLLDRFVIGPTRFSFSVCLSVSLCLAKGSYMILLLLSPFGTVSVVCSSQSIFCCLPLHR